MITLLLFGFLLGMRHALEADHVAAVASLATGASSAAETVRLGVAWGVGHTLTLLAVGTLVILLEVVLSRRLADGLEMLVGIMLVGLGVDVLRRLLTGSMPRHTGGIPTGGSATSDIDPAHRPATIRTYPGRALAVGLMHGMAGSAALILLTLQTAPTTRLGIAYMVLFGIGSIAGMAMLSAVIAVPLRLSRCYLAALGNVLHATIGVATVALGLYTLWSLA